MTNCMQLGDIEVVTEISATVFWLFEKPLGVRNIRSNRILQRKSCCEITPNDEGHN